MAFMARQTPKGRFVDRKQLSGSRTSGLSNQWPELSDLSDSEESNAGFTDRTLAAAKDTDTDTDTDSSTCTLMGNRDDDIGEFLYSDTDTITNSCHELEEEEAEAEEALAGLTIAGNKSGFEEDGQSETRTLVPAESIGDCSDILGPTLIQGRASPTDSLGSFNSCSSAKTYILGIKSTEDLALPEAIEDRELMTSTNYILDTESSSQSVCSWSDAYGAVVETSEGGKNFLPSLNLENCSPEISTSFKSLEQKKDRDVLHFEAWKQRKAEEQKKKILAAKREREKRQRAITERLEESQRQVEEWRRQKEQQERNKTYSLSQKKSCTSVSTNASRSTAVSRQKETAEERKERLKEWERRKVAQQQQERDRARRQREEMEQERKERMQRSQGAWSKWMQNIQNRPKPVPLNQGFDSLRGTASKIFVNPNEWDSSTDPPSDARDV